MTERDLLHRYVPAIAEMIAGLRGMTPGQRQRWKSDCLEYAGSLGPFVHGFIHKMHIVIDEYLKREEMDQKMEIDGIKIYPCFMEHSPKAEKMEQKEQYFMETGFLQSQIVLNKKGYLIDGYISYLLARQHGIQSVPIRYGRRQVVRASHRPGSKLYTWELSHRLVGRVSAGDKLLVHTQGGIRIATVAAVEEYEGQGQLRMAVKIAGRKQGAVGHDEAAGQAHGEEAVDG